MRRIITLTTDFGLFDPYVGIMKGVILGIAPEAVLVDITHDVPAQDVVAGALALEAVCEFFPAGTIHVAVVDPGVGSGRAAVAVETEFCYFVGPDNGLFTAALARALLSRAVRLTNPAYHRRPVSATFHGRDIFAPVAAHLAAGAAFETLGDPLTELVTLDLPRPVARADSLELHVVHVDRFGNLITDLTADSFILDFGRARLHIGGREIVGISRTYADAAQGQPVACFGSSGRLEIGVRDGSAAETLRAGTGTILLLRNEG
jgi:S-adenosylmethionine hydrolase